MTSSRGRVLASAVCGAVGTLLIVIALLLGYLTRSIFNEQAFSVRVAASLEDPRFAEFAAEQLADAVIAVKPDLIGLRPVLIGVGRGVVASPPFRAAVRRSARLAHRTIMSGTAKTIVLDVRDLSVLLESAAQNSPGISKKIPKGVTTAIAKLSALPGGDRAARLIRLGNRMRAGTLVLLILGIGLCAVCVSLADRKRQVMVRIGVALAVLGVVLAILARFGGDGIALFARHSPDSPAIAGLGNAFLRGLMPWGVGLMFCGLVLAAASASLLENTSLLGMAAAAWTRLTGPERMRVRLVRGIVGAALGIALMFAPLASLIVIAWLLGLVIVFAGLHEAFVAALHLLPNVELPERATRRHGSRRNAFLAASGIAVVLLGAASWLILRSDATPAETQAITACNGSPGLCDRTLDQVVFPTSHNSMSGADIAGWMFPNQNAGIPKQLADGVRGFLIDVHYGWPVREKVMTDVSNEANAMAKYEAVVGKDGAEAALRIRERLAGEEHGERDVYMCHGFCELGAEKFVPVLEGMRDFLVANPGEVIVIVIQDESVTPADIDRCFAESGLADFVYKGPTGPWPTLREMVESDQRVVVMAENVNAGVPWYHLAVEILQETPYAFHDTTQFSNEPNRGGTAGSLALLNHWIETTPLPKPSNAAIVNRHDFLMKRILGFQKRRGRLPNLVAVDFYATGDLIQVCRELNEEPLPAKRLARR